MIVEYSSVLPWRYSRWQDDIIPFERSLVILGVVSSTKTSHLDVVTPNISSIIDKISRIKLKNKTQLIMSIDQLSFFNSTIVLSFFSCVRPSIWAPVGARQEIWMTVIRTGKEFIYVCTQTLMNVVYSWSTCNSKLFSHFFFFSFVQIKTHSHTYYTRKNSSPPPLSLYCFEYYLCICMWWWEANMNKKMMDKQWFKIVPSIDEDLHNNRVWWNMKNIHPIISYIFILMIVHSLSTTHFYISRSKAEKYARAHVQVAYCLK